MTVKAPVFKKKRRMCAIITRGGMQNDSPFLGVCFRRGAWDYLGDEVVMQGTGGPYVHSEFILGKNRHDMRCYTSCASSGHDKGLEGFMLTRRWSCLPSSHDWEVVTFPLNDGMQGYKRAYSFILQLVSMRIPYNYGDLWQCCVKVLLPSERDILCTDMRDWQRHGVFCSQACLLLLRHFSNLNLITLHASVRADICNINSRGCSPNCLYRILSPGKKNKTGVESIRGV